jgi:hypothetical protein
LYLNWSSIQTSVAESLARRLRISVCHDPVYVCWTLLASNDADRAAKDKAKRVTHCVKPGRRI